MLLVIVAFLGVVLAPWEYNLSLYDEDGWVSGIMIEQETTRYVRYLRVPDSDYIVLQNGAIVKETPDLLRHPLCLLDDGRVISPGIENLYTDFVRICRNSGNSSPASRDRRITLLKRIGHAISFAMSDCPDLVPVIGKLYFSNPRMFESIFEPLFQDLTESQMDDLLPHSLEAAKLNDPSSFVNLTRDQFTIQGQWSYRFYANNHELWLERVLHIASEIGLKDALIELSLVPAIIESSGKDKLSITAHKLWKALDSIIEGDPSVRTEDYKTIRAGLDDTNLGSLRRLASHVVGKVAINEILVKLV